MPCAHEAQVVPPNASQWVFSRRPRSDAGAECSSKLEAQLAAYILVFINSDVMMKKTGC